MFRTKMGELTLHVTSFDVLGKVLDAAARQVARPGRRREALPPALRRPDRQPRRARHVDHAQPHHRRDAPLHRRARFLRSRDADAAARRGRRGGAAVRHPRQRARPRDAAAHRDRAEPQAPDRRRAGARLRDRPHLPQRRHRHDPQPRVHDARALRGVLGRLGHDGVQRGADRASGRRPLPAAGPICPTATGRSRSSARSRASSISTRWQQYSDGKYRRERCSIRAGAAAIAHELGLPRSPSHGHALDKIFERVVEPHLVAPTFVNDYPVVLSPLAKRKAGDPELTDRYELFCAPMEISNAFTELNDPDDQRARFEAQVAERAPATKRSPNPTGISCAPSNTACRRRPESASASTASSCF